HNANRQQTRVRVFELGRTFYRDDQVPDGGLTVAGVAQPVRLAAAAWGPALEEQWGVPARTVDFYDVKRDVEALLGPQAPQLQCVAAAHPALHPGRSARLFLNDKPLGWLGELHPRLAQQAELTQAPVVFELDVEVLAHEPIAQPQALSRQPMVVRDLAFWVPDGVSYADIRKTLAQTIASNANLAIIKDIRLFDIWRDASSSSQEKSMALHFLLQDPEVTLDDSTVEQCMD